MASEHPTFLVPLQYTADDGGGFPFDTRPVDRLSFSFDDTFEDVVMVTSQNVAALREQGLADVGRLELIVADSPDAAAGMHLDSDMLADVRRETLENGFGLVVISTPDLDFRIEVKDARTMAASIGAQPDDLVPTSELIEEQIERARKDPENSSAGAMRQARRLLKEASDAGHDVREALDTLTRQHAVTSPSQRTYFAPVVNSWVEDVMRDGFQSELVDGRYGQAFYSTLEAALCVQRRGGEGGHLSPEDFQIVVVDCHEEIPRAERQVPLNDPAGGERVLKVFGQGEEANGIHWKPKRRVVGSDYTAEAEPWHTYYHVTHEADLQSILIEGFEGGHGDVGFGVYLFDDLAAAEEYIARGGWDGTTDPEDLEIIEVTCDALPGVEPHPDWPDPENYAHVVFKGMNEDDPEDIWEPQRSHIFPTPQPGTP
ncbi:hypothetical protein [Salipiger mucosus]|uniref:Uncharacterized protein n=1 Tax=Salipiger mucosus DSM 16094 TaxID=1123237 RepID=S9QEV5_9RHOB|nr:hypothetical protein [Salipiger mucosus]EPX78083.1 hypothetical protein Salmuc_03405 [Salipiger mucosus DSM 16094]